jgi:hypothetical protein
MAARIFPDTSTVLKLHAPVQEWHYQFKYINKRADRVHGRSLPYMAYKP